MVGMPYLLLGTVGLPDLPRREAEGPGRPASADLAAAGEEVQASMSGPLSRRSFVAGSLAAAAAVGDFAFLGRCRPARPRTPRPTQSRPVQPRHRAARPPDRGHAARQAPRGGRRQDPQGDELSASCWRRLMLAGVRGIQPRPVGFKFHAVLVVNSAHLATLAAAGPRPLAAAVLGARQLQGVAGAQQKRGRLAHGRRSTRRSCRPATRRSSVFVEAMDAWDEEGADAAVAVAGAQLRRHRGDRAVLALRGARLPRHRPQGDLRRQRLAHAADHRLAARRADPALAGLRPARPRRERQPGEARPTRPTAPAARTCRG